MENLIVCITGASGAVYAQRLLHFLCRREYTVHVSISDAAFLVIKHELGIDLNPVNPDFTGMVGYAAETICYYRNSDIGAAIASSGYPVRAMVIVPCSMNTLCSVAHGISSNLVQRAASITIKEGRKLVLVPRETPLSAIHLDAMVKLSSAGACILPAMPGFYHNPKTIMDQVDFIVARILDVLGIQHTLIPEWKGEVLINAE